MAKVIQVWVDEEDHGALVEEAEQRSKIQRRRVPLSEIVRNELAKSAARFRRINAE
jgi:hypothetical protein